jgi:Carbohydrate binding module (family 6)
MKPPSRFSAVMLGIAAALAVTSVARAGAIDHDPSESASQEALTPQQAMLWKYTARCALRANQELEAPAGRNGDGQKFKGALGLAPEWREGKCDGACQEKVSSCLAALTNQTGDHVLVSMLSAAPSLAAMSANDNDLDYPFQEGAFFGNVFTGEAYVCRGRDAEKGQQLKRFCALAPGLCSGLTNFFDAGPCEQSCRMSCTALSDGTERCAAVSCRDPKGRVWNHPITTYMRNRIEAGNADIIVGAVSHDSGLEGLRDGGHATYRQVDFGSVPGAIRTVIANVSAPAGGGRIEVWADGRRRLGVLSVRSTGGVAKDLSARLRTRGLSGLHNVVLRFAGLPGNVRVADIGLR